MKRTHAQTHIHPANRHFALRSSLNSSQQKIEDFLSDYFKQYTAKKTGEFQNRQLEATTCIPDYESSIATHC